MTSSLNTYSKNVPKKEKKNAVLRTLLSIPHAMENFFYWLGCNIHDHSRWFIIIPLLATLILTPGLIQMKKLKDEPKIWTLRGRKSISNDTAKTFHSDGATICKSLYRDDYGDIAGELEGQLDQFHEQSLPEYCEKLKANEEALKQGAEDKQVVMLMMFAKEDPETGRKYSFTDQRLMDVLFEIDIFISFGLWVPDKQRFTAAVFTNFNSTLTSICNKDVDGKCEQYSMLPVRRF